MSVDSQDRIISKPGGQLNVEFRSFRSRRHLVNSAARPARNKEKSKARGCHSQKQKNIINAVPFWHVRALLPFMNIFKKREGSDENFSKWNFRCFTALPLCTEDEFGCDNGQCIPASKRCDFIRHCYDSSDEEGCGKYLIRQHFVCRFLCIHMNI